MSKFKVGNKEPKKEPARTMKEKKQARLAKLAQPDLVRFPMGKTKTFQ